MERPDPREYGEYYRRYVDLVPEGGLSETLAGQFAVTRALLSSVTPEQGMHRYTPGSWSVRQVVGHMIDTERVFANRALWIARQRDLDLPGMDQDVWAEVGGHQDRPVADLLDEWGCVRESTLHLMTGLPEGSDLKEGVASGTRVTVRALFWIIGGHELHHRVRLGEDYGIGS